MGWEKLDSHITQLLFKHDCVIIPGFGGFVANYQGAVIHPTQHIFQPPAKKLAFNKNLDKNDGLLAHAISESEGLSFFEASAIIDKAVWELKNSLQQQGKIELGTLGILKMDVEKNLQFIPSHQQNFLPDSFGLASFQAPPVMRGNKEYTFVHTFNDRPSIKPVRKIGWQKVLRYAIPMLALPLALAFYWKPVGRQLFKENISGFFSSSEPSKYKPHSHHFNPVFRELKTIETVPVEMMEASPSAQAEQTATPEPAAAPAVEILPNNANSDGGDFLVIAGCFSIKDNADKQVSMLQQKNYNASLAGQNASGLFRVSSGRCNSLPEANNLAAKLRAEGIDCWVLHN